MNLIVETILETFVEGFSKEVTSLSSRLLAGVFVFFYIFVVIGLFSFGVSMISAGGIFGYLVVLLSGFIAVYYIIVFLKKLEENKKEHGLK